jgi:hypothetical protein
VTPHIQFHYIPDQGNKKPDKECHHCVSTLVSYLRHSVTGLEDTYSNRLILILICGLMRFHIFDTNLF